MQTRQSHLFMLELRKLDGTALEQVPVAADWEPALEAACFLALRRFPGAAIGPDSVAELRPIWHTQRGAPYVSEVEVAVMAPPIEELLCRVPTTFFKSIATDASASLVKRGVLEAGEHFTYLVTAFPASPRKPSTVEKRSRFAIEKLASPMPLKSSLLADFLKRSVAAGEQNETDTAVFIPYRIISEADQLTRDAGGIETGSILIGHLHRDIAGGELFLEVTAQIPALAPEATATKISFGPETWDAVRGALALRNEQEQWVGWFHSHPARYWCTPKCPPEDRARCPLQRSFFSADDCDVQRTVFSKGFHIALLVTNTDAGLQHAMFSWRNGVIVQRGFRILDDDEKHKPAVATIAAATIGESENEKVCP